MRDIPDPRLRVFVIWEPVLLTDWHAPGTAAVSRVPDARAVQFWDPQHALSAEIRRAANADPRAILGEHRLHANVVWDFVALYPPGVEWRDAWPAAQFAGAPVVRVIDELKRYLLGHDANGIGLRTGAQAVRRLGGAEIVVHQANAAAARAGYIQKQSSAGNGAGVPQRETIHVGQNESRSARRGGTAAESIQLDILRVLQGERAAPFFGAGLFPGNLDVLQPQVTRPANAHGIYGLL